MAVAEFREYNDPNGLVTVGKSLLIDVLPALSTNSIWTAEKLEGFAVARDRSIYVVTDKDGLSMNEYLGSYYRSTDSNYDDPYV